MEDADDPFNELRQQMNKLSIRAPNFFPHGTTADDVISADDNVLSIMDEETVDVAMNDYGDASEGSICLNGTDMPSALEIFVNICCLAKKPEKFKGE